MDRIARLVTRHPRWVVGVVFLLSLVLARELRHLRLEVRLSDEVPAGHPYTQIDDRLAERLGAHQTAIVAVGVRDGDVVNPDTLARIRRLTDGIAKIPGVVPSSVLSLTAPHVKAVEADGETVRVEALVPVEVPGDAASLQLCASASSRFRCTSARSSRPTRSGAMILADFENDAHTEAITEALEALAAQERDAATEIWVGGQPPALAALNGATRGIIPLIALALAVIALVHYEAFRTAQAVILPLVTAALSVVWAMGITAALGFNLTPWTAITAVLVLSVAAGHAVQILKRYYECYHELGDNRAAVAASLRPHRAGDGDRVLASPRRALGRSRRFGIPAVRDFGLMAAFGILSHARARTDLHPRRAARCCARRARPRRCASAATRCSTRRSTDSRAPCRRSRARRSRSQRSSWRSRRSGSRASK